MTRADPDCTPRQLRGCEQAGTRGYAGHTPDCCKKNTSSWNGAESTLLFFTYVRYMPWKRVSKDAHGSTLRHLEAHGQEGVGRLDGKATQHDQGEHAHTGVGGHPLCEQQAEIFPAHAVEAWAVVR